MRSTLSFAEHTPARRIAYVGALTALACVLSLAETAMLPPLPVPGVRLGLANLAVVLALALLGPRDAFVVSIGRVILTSAFAGTIGGPAFLLALGGALSAWAVMCTLARAGETFSVVGWSVAGSAAHIAGQLVLAALLTSAAAVVSFVPLSLALAIPSGLAIGFTARLLFSRLPLPYAVVER
jgi:heptaprenyl diphosphate synthase